MEEIYKRDFFILFFLTWINGGDQGSVFGAAKWWGEDWGVLILGHGLGPEIG